MITRRKFLTGTASFTAATVGLTGYAMAVEPMSLGVTSYKVTPNGWPAGLSLRIAAIADVHACEPWMSAERIAGIAARANALEPDLIVMLGDYAAAHRIISEKVRPDAWSEALSVCRAPLGVHAILGNHDWWDDNKARLRGRGPVEGRVALERRGIPVYENDAMRLVKNGNAFWVAGLGDQLAFAGMRRRFPVEPGVDDLPATLSKVTDDAPVILLAHEPDIFPEVPPRVALTLSGHTHGGQIRVLGYAPVIPSRYRGRYAYGHIIERNRHLIVSGGLGCSIAPVRIGMPPEIVLVEVGV